MSCKTKTEPAIQLHPLPEKIAVVILFNAFSTSASSKTTTGDYPPNSSVSDA